MPETVSGGHLAIRRVKYDGRRGVIINAGYVGIEHVVPPAGEKYAFDRDQWRRQVEVWVSSTGRSARVWVDGVEIK